jgi:hypothetical protein
MSVIPLLRAVPGLSRPGQNWLPRRDDMGAMVDMTPEAASRQIRQWRRDSLLPTTAPAAGSAARSGHA